MSTKKVDQDIEEIFGKIDVPEDVNVTKDGNIINVNGKLGKNSKDFTKIPIIIDVDNKQIIIKPYGMRKKYVALINTTKSIITNMIKGVQNGFTYKLKIAYAHFPITVKIKDKQVSVENYFGERNGRISRIIGEQTKVTISGDDIIVQGPNLEHVSQTASNIESSTKIKNKDQRVFLDGVYIYSKSQGME